MAEQAANREKVPRRRGKKGKEAANDRKKKSNGSGEEVVLTKNTGGNMVYKPHKTLLILLTEATPTWYECGRNSPGRDDTIYSRSSSESKKIESNPFDVVSKYRTLADAIYQQEVTLFRSSSSSDKDEQWVEGTMKRGTLKDRIAAMSVVISSNPIHKLYALDMLLNLAGVSTGNRTNATNTNERVAQMAAEALMDLFINTLLPRSRKLISLDTRPLSLYDSGNEAKRNISPRILLLWRFEEILKTKYSLFISQYLGRTLSQKASASLDLTKINALRTACTMLREIPEGEQMLLSMVVNKIGDPSKKIAAAAGHELRRLLEVHPVMSSIVAREVQQLAHRPNLSTRALYNCIIFLNQLKLVKDESDTDSSKNASLPASLIKTYFQLFEVAVKKGKSSGEKKGTKKSEADIAMNSRLLGALLTGVNRAHPYLPENDVGMQEHIDSLYRISHTSPPTVCTQALMLLFHLVIGSNDISDLKEGGQSQNISRRDRFYRALYSKIGDVNMLFGRQLTLFFNLIYKAMKNDSDSLRVVSFGKRLLHMAFHYSPSIISGVLFLLSEVMKHQPALQKCFFSTDGKQSTFDPSKREPSSAFFCPQVVDEDVREMKNEKEDKMATIPANLWEITLTVHHYHPSVRKFSSSLSEIKYSGDPLHDFSLAPFLDKFAFRNPKSSKKIGNKLMRGESIGERRSGLEGNIDALSSLPMNDPSRLKQSKNISEREEFFHNFFVERAKRDEAKGIVRGNKDQEDFDPLASSESKGFEYDWDDTDDEEEAFVQGLSESLMKASGGGIKVDYDDEDPDMDDWSDADSNDSDPDDDDDNDDDDDEKDSSALIGNVASEESRSEGEESSGDIDDMERFLDAENDDMSGIHEPEYDTDSKETKEKEISSSFADASEYEKIVKDALSEESNSKRKRHLNDSAESGSLITSNSSNNKRRNKKRRRKSKVKIQSQD